MGERVWVDDVMNVDGRRGGCRYRDSPLDLIMHNSNTNSTYISILLAPEPSLPHHSASYLTSITLPHHSAFYLTSEPSPFNPRVPTVSSVLASPVRPPHPPFNPQAPTVSPLVAPSQTIHHLAPPLYSPTRKPPQFLSQISREEAKHQGFSI